MADKDNEKEAVASKAANRIKELEADLAKSNSLNALSADSRKHYDGLNEDARLTASRRVDDRQTEPAKPDPDEQVPDPVNQLRWQDIHIRFTSDFQVQITTPQGAETRNYVEMGLEDGRNKKSSKPTDPWWVFKALAIDNGTLGVTFQTKSKIEKAVQHIRKKLRSTFSPTPEGDPIPWDRRKRCFRTSFRLSYPDHERL